MVVLLLSFDLFTVQHIYPRGDDQMALVVEKGIGSATQTAVQLQWSMGGEGGLRTTFIDLDYAIDKIAGDQGRSAMMINMGSRTSAAFTALIISGTKPIPGVSTTESPHSRAQARVRGTLSVVAT